MHFLFPLLWFKSHLGQLFRFPWGKRAVLGVVALFALPLPFYFTLLLTMKCVYVGWTVYKSENMVCFKLRHSHYTLVLDMRDFRYMHTLPDAIRNGQTITELISHGIDLLTVLIPESTTPKDARCVCIVYVCETTT